MNKFEHSAFVRDQLEEKNKIVVGNGVIVYDAIRMAWALPGRRHTQNYACAVRQAKQIDILLGGSPRPEATSKGFRV